MNQLLGFAGTLYKAELTCMEYLDEANQLFSMVDKEQNTEGKPILYKVLDDVGFQGNILAFYMRMEATKLAGVAKEEQIDTFHRMAENTVKCASDVHNIQTKLMELSQVEQVTVDTTGFKDVILIELLAFNTKMIQISEEAGVEGVALGKQGGAVVFLANEYKHLSDRINSVAENLTMLL